MANTPCRFASRMPQPVYRDNSHLYSGNPQASDEYPYDEEDLTDLPVMAKPSIWVEMPCRRCTHIFRYPAGTPWYRVWPEVNAHWERCPGSTLALRSRDERVAEKHIPENDQISRAGTAEGSVIDRRSREPDERQGPESRPSDGPPPAKKSKKSVTPTREPDSTATPNHRRLYRGGEQRDQERKAALEADEYTGEVDAKWVECVACKQKIKLDARGSYYVSLWKKHKGYCASIAMMEAKKQGNGNQGAASISKNKVADKPSPPRGVNSVPNGTSERDKITMTEGENLGEFVGSSGESSQTTHRDHEEPPSLPPITDWYRDQTCPGSMPSRYGYHPHSFAWAPSPVSRSRINTTAPRVMDSLTPPRETRGGNVETADSES
ncbi:hypothetical protein JAAARDRAFT_66983 [Jaapia argillacea MUCL 33604]|uniref:Uncharacterized protein n=1 Tax=Jaapia argillacea MUCL 33604 TaxID=933084 RepID=A0A067Q4X3_9AGAM|nr:hypothetical protein JAAARDRAFT_66983 [Jaapia argillacea MUCL 33604]